LQSVFQRGKIDDEIFLLRNYQLIKLGLKFISDQFTNFLISLPKDKLVKFLEMRIEDISEPLQDFLAAQESLNSDIYLLKRLAEKTYKKSKSELKKIITPSELNALERLNNDGFVINENFNEIHSIVFNKAKIIDFLSQSSHLELINYLNSRNGVKLHLEEYLKDKKELVVNSNPRIRKLLKQSLQSARDELTKLL
jgi:hypothetical protein